MLQIHLSAGKGNLRGALESTFADEVLDGDNGYLCPVEQRQVKATRKTTIASAPRFLFLQLQRFKMSADSAREEKINQNLEFPVDDALDLTPFMAGTESRTDGKYRLVGVIVHTGTAQGGHYYSYIRNPLDSNASSDDHGTRASPDVPGWIKLNDSKVSTASMEQMKYDAFGSTDATRSQRGTSAYILLYERMEVDGALSAAAILNAEEVGLQRPGIPRRGTGAAGAVHDGSMDHLRAKPAVALSLLPELLQSYVSRVDESYLSGQSLADPLLGRIVLLSMMSARSLAQGHCNGLARRRKVRELVISELEASLGRAPSSDEVEA